jgi:2-polyprenyl-3-methyl-5-hydroxy-6-metoxy-1,4-benzoquinol methylase
VNKAEFYSRTDIVDRYEGRRFGGASGRLVQERELRAVRDLLPPGGKILDVPVGTGRLSLYLREQGFDCHGLDYSESMLELCRSRGLTQLTQGDIFKTPLPARSFDAVVSLRFHFHFRDVRPVLQNVFEGLKPGGVYVLDTFTRSPRAWLPFLGEAGRVHLHTVEEFSQLARSVGFEVAQTLPCFLFSPLIYRFLPAAVVQTLDRLEPSVPPSWLARVFWQLRRPSETAPAA